MTRKIIPALAGLAALAVPALAHAQDASSSVSLAGEVQRACVLGEPADAEFTLADLTDDATGRLDSTLTGSAPVASTAIAGAWCNYPSTLSVDASPMALTTPPAWAVPNGFSRRITYTATLTGWPTVLTDRPLMGDAAKSVDADAAHAAPPAGLLIEVSALETLNAAGTAEATGLVLEAGTYAGAIVVTLALKP